MKNQTHTKGVLLLRTVVMGGCYGPLLWVGNHGYRVGGWLRWWSWGTDCVCVCVWVSLRVSLWLGKHHEPIVCVSVSLCVSVFVCGSVFLFVRMDECVFVFLSLCVHDFVYVYFCVSVCGYKSVWVIGCDSLCLSVGVCVCPDCMNGILASIPFVLLLLTSKNLKTFKNDFDQNIKKTFDASSMKYFVQTINGTIMRLFLGDFSHFTQIWRYLEMCIL